MQSLEELRAEINAIDTKIIDLFAERYSIVKQVWIYKRQHNLPALDSVRRKQLVHAHINQAKQKWLSEKFIVDIWERIHQESLSIEQQKNPA